MVARRFALEAVFAGKGDALILHHGPRSAPKFTLIDGGHRAIYRRYLLARLNELRLQHKPGGKILLDPVILSHADEDHLFGLLEMVQHLDDSIADRNELGPFPAEINNIWLNRFVDILGSGTDDELVPRLTAAALAEGDMIPPSVTNERELRAVLASTRQGVQLQKLAGKADLAIEINKPFGDDLIQAPEDASKPVMAQLSAGTTLRVIAPEKTEIAKLRKKWEKDMKEIKKKADAKPTAFTDGSAHNLASLVFEVTQTNDGRERTMLLTGDARGDKLVDSLDAQGLLADDEHRVDLFKLPHHGSFSNVTKDTFKTIVADHYLISANGEHHNPEVDTLKALVEGRRASSKKRSPFALYVTFPKAAFEEISDQQASRSSKLAKQRDALEQVHEWAMGSLPDECTLTYRQAERRSTIVDLGDVPVTPD